MAIDPLKLTRDQRRAVYAYEKISQIAPDKRSDYKTALMAFGANILKGGLVAAIADLERRRAKGGQLVLDHIGNARIPGIGTNVSHDVRVLPVESYMLATRETLQVAMWLKRAVQATSDQ